MGNVSTIPIACQIVRTHLLCRVDDVMPHLVLAVRPTLICSYLVKVMSNPKKIEKCTQLVALDDLSLLKIVRAVKKDKS
jgi:hypothetical protein